ncbi:venom protein 302-like [Centruroides vittatus]|uniref:venom protein 302-like n=1 Tax=Centruroides vittatus TaxID=120091 RepID=UPI00350F48B9
MSDKLLRLAIFCVLIYSIYSLSCPCHTMKDLRDSCKIPENCPAGLTLDACGCCKVCAKALDEKCGGPWETSGRCAKGLSCIKPENLPEYQKWQAEGVCMRDL